ncbi:MAG: hypothetical protein COB30_017285 [Ectothiorhodospiraceae bacterium]|nr:hypothetical protein [Thiotrichaceae bacterium]MBL1277836.1 hypothetical protein [Ectothiorhodospiraceae bacterium]
MKIRNDADAIILRDQLLSIYQAKEFSVKIRPRISFNYRVVGSDNFALAITLQIKAIMGSTEHGNILLQELAKLPEKIDFIEYDTSHAASHDGFIVVLHNATTPQGNGLGRFQSKSGKFLRGSFLPEMALAHELFHAGQLQQAKFFEPYCNLLCSWTGGPWKLPKEPGAIRYTNQIRIDKNLGYVRTYHAAYGGRKIDSYEEASTRHSKK